MKRKIDNNKLNEIIENWIDDNNFTDQYSDDRSFMVLDFAKEELIKKLQQFFEESQK